MASADSKVLELLEDFDEIYIVMQDALINLVFYVRVTTLEICRLAANSLLDVDAPLHSFLASATVVEGFEGVIKHYRVIGGSCESGR